MSDWRRSKLTGRRDNSEPKVIEALFAGGADAVVKHSGKDEPDLFVSYLGSWFPLETKTNAANLTPGQAKWWREVAKQPPRVARTPAQAVKWLRVEQERSQSLASLLRAQGARGGGVDAALEEHVDGLPETCGGKDPTQPA